jgi:DivIVA domain-containing protein
MTVLTPIDVHNVAFRTAPLGRRGYDEEEVDGFLDRVEASLTALYQEIARLRDELDAAQSSAPANPGSQSRVATEALLRAELELIKNRLAWVEQVLNDR